MAAREREPHGDQLAKIDAFDDARLQTSRLRPDRFRAQQRRGRAAGAQAVRGASFERLRETGDGQRRAPVRDASPTVPSSRFDSPRKRATKVSTGRS